MSGKEGGKTAILNRIYRKQLSSDRTLGRLADGLAANSALATRILVREDRLIESCRRITDHCQRLLREKETLQGLIKKIIARRAAAK